MQQRGEIAVGRPLKRVELGHQRFDSGPDDIARYVRAVRPLAAAAARAPDVSVLLRQIDHARFPTVRVGRVEPRGRVDVVAQLANLTVHSSAPTLRSLARRERRRRSSVRGRADSRGEASLKTIDESAAFDSTPGRRVH